MVLNLVLLEQYRCIVTKCLQSLSSTILKATALQVTPNLIEFVSILYILSVMAEK